ncbi:hypothetical protein DUZ99_18030 [Xylanibacillus composti]|uniref:Lipoprotein n=1 Tax=Xylanibacillus composti TaxID=1572762 RepID=A0A8J4H5B2_9BACL|nr:hypothetical protein [Xylanibacillus composti]MDT9726880.1 hypothetical protein [Xylanibacillus composti]GIQ69807.1 hypothetical protein XYCOK13_26310 [Xylanibacillus composti]
MMKVWIAFLGASLLTACGGGEFEPDAYSVDDMCVVQVDTEERVCYEMTRSEIEAVLGAGTEGSFGWIEYEGGVTVAYRDEQAAGLFLDRTSAGKYRTARGAESGMSKDEIKQLYGTKAAVELGGNNLDYFYDSKEGRALEELPRKSQEEMMDVHVISFLQFEHGADRIMLLDARMAMYFE